MTAPAVTVILPFRNQGRLLAQACASLRRQSLRHWRAVLVDDGSAAEAVTLAMHLCREDGRFQLLQVRDKPPLPGPWLARNLGVKAATSALVAFLDADDLWHPLKLERQLALHRQSPRLLSVCGYHRFRAETLAVVATRTPPPALDFQALLRGNAIPLSSVVVDRDLVLGAGGFRGERHEDFGLWLRLFAAADPPAYACIPEPLMAYRLHRQSLSAARHRSLPAVARLFRQHLPCRRQRWRALARWTLERLSEGDRPWRQGPGATGQLPESFGAQGEA